MAQNPTLDYTRQDLRKATKFTEGDYRGINPREFFRSLKRSLEEIKDQEGDFKYTTHGGRNESLAIESEEVGSKTGTVEGRLVAQSEYEDIGSGSLEFKRYGPHGAWMIIIGLILALPTIGVTLIISIIGLYLYLKEERGEVPLLRQDVIRVLKSGEVSERTIADKQEKRTDIFANLNVIYAGDTFIKVDTDELEEYPLSHRKAIVKEVAKRYNRITDDEDLEREVSDGLMGNFIAHLKSVANLSVEPDVREIGELQGILNSKFEYRVQYSEQLLRLLPTDTENELEAHQEGIMDELEELAEDMDVYVEREGIVKV